jgi:hypothetical protein
MTEKVTIDGKLDDKPIPQELKTKVQHALKSALEAEFKVGGLQPSRHFSVTHFSIVYES